jgi:hypothetical protein
MVSTEGQITRKEWQVQNHRQAAHVPVHFRPLHATLLRVVLRVFGRQEACNQPHGAAYIQVPAVWACTEKMLAIPTQSDATIFQNDTSCERPAAHSLDLVREQSRNLSRAQLFSITVVSKLPVRGRSEREELPFLRDCGCVQVTG